MKIIFLILFSFPIFCVGQTSDSLRMELRALNKKYEESQKEIDQIKFQLNTSHRIYKRGTILYVSGFVSSLIGGLIINKTEMLLAGSIFLVSGPILVLTGEIHWLDSHRHLNFNLPRKGK